MSDGRPLSSEIRDRLADIRDLRAGDGNPFGIRLDVEQKLHELELLLYRILRDISA